MSDLYKEAIADAKKLRELAEEDARKSIMEKVSPYIKKMIAKETANASSFFFEEEEDASLQPPDSTTSSVSPEPIASDVPVVDPAAAVDTTSAPIEDTASVAPIAASGAEVANIPLPDADGKITIDFEQLFVEPGIGDTVAPVDVGEIPPGEDSLVVPAAYATPPAPVEPVVAGSSSEGDLLPSSSSEEGMDGLEAPAADLSTPPEEEIPSEEPKTITESQFNTKLTDAVFNIEHVLHADRARVSDIAFERLKGNLIGLLESLDKMRESGTISENKARHNEKRLEFLFLKLKEGALANSYKSEKDKKEDPMGKSLKEYAAKLFESDEQENLAMDSASSGDTGLPVRKDASEHAKNQSGVSPEVDDLFKEELEGGSKTVAVAAKAGTVDAKALPSTGKAQKKPLEQGEPVVTEEVEAEGHAGFGDSSEKPVASPDMFFEIDEKELLEAVAAIRKEKAAAKAEKGGWEKGKPAAKSSSSKSILKKESTVKENAMMDTSGMEEDLVLNVSLPDELESELEVDDLDVDLMLTGDEDEVDGLEAVDSVEDEGGEDIFADDESSEDDVSMDSAELEDEIGSEEEEVLLTDEEDDLSEVSDNPMTGPASDRAPMPLREARTLKVLRHREAKARKLLEAHRAEAKQLKTEMAETNLFLSKLLYLNKFLQKEGLSRKVKQQIVEHLDRASNLAEAKEIYLKIKKKLDESASAGRNSPGLTGSASKPTAAGSARLNESANASSTSGDETIVGTFERWQKLARISKGED